MAAPTASGSPPKSARASIRHHLRELQVAYESLQEQQAQVAAQTILSPTRRRATDPGSPALPPRCTVRSLPTSPLPLCLPASAPGSPSQPPGPRPARSPSRAPLTAGRLQQRRRQRSHSAAATPVTDAAQLHERLAAAASAASAGAEPLDSYHCYAAQLFERRFCPLRTGLQGQEQEQGRGQTQDVAAERPQQCAAPPTAELEQQAGAPPGEHHHHQQQQQQQQGGPLQQSQPRRRLPPAAAPSPQQQAVPQPHAAPVTPADRQLAATEAAPASTGCSSGGSHHSYASEEGDVVQVASPERGLAPEASTVEAEPAQPRPPQPGAAAGTAQRASISRPASAQRGGVQALQPAASPLPLLSAALQLLTSPAGQPCSLQGIGPLRLAFDAAARASADAGAQQVQHTPAGPAAAAAAEGPGGGAGCGSAADGEQQLEEHTAPAEPAEADGSSGEAPAATGATSPLPTSQQAAPVGLHPADAAAAAGERPRSPAGRAQALQRLKQRRLLQRGDSALAAPSVRSSCADGLPQLPQQPEGEASGQAAEGGAREEAAEQCAADGARQVQQGVQAAEQMQQQPAAPPLPPLQQVQPLPAEQLAGPAGGSSPLDHRQTQPLPHQQQPQQEQQQPAEAGGGDEEEGAECKPPRPFLRRRSQMVPMQKLPDWKAVRPRTSSRWDGGGSGASTPGGGASTPAAGTPGGSSTPAASRPGTPTAARLAAARAAPPATAPPPLLQRHAHGERPRPATASRVGGSAGGSRGGAARPRTAGGQGSAAGGSSQPATYVLSPPCAPPAAVSGHADQRQQHQHQQRRQQRGISSVREEVPWSGGGSKQGKRGGGGGGGGSARTTPFAPRPNSGESRQPWDRGHGGDGQARRQQRVRGTPIYDASTLLPLGVDGLLGGSGGGGLPDLLVAGSLYAGAHGPAPTTRLGSHRLARSGGSAAAGMQLLPAGMPHPELPETEAGEAAAVDVGPLDDLLCAVDRMLHQVERALD